MNEEGEWVENREELENLVVNFYNELFREDPSSGEEFTRGCFPWLSEASRLRLVVEYPLDKTLIALNGMGSLKVPRPDGFPPLFYKSAWELIGRDLHQFVQGVLRGGVIPIEVADTLLVLIPKEDKPSTIKSFRSISLCIVCVKVESKRIMNRFKGMLVDMISSNQAPSIPGHQNVDNIVIC